MRRREMLGLAAAGIAAAAGRWSLAEDPAQPDPKPGDKPAEAFKPVDITAEVREWNGPKFAAPPTDFRAGHVTPRKLDDKALAKNEQGYAIQLPSKAPIPTPTVYNGKLFVSGGFHSKEYYCFDAATGKFVWGIDLDDDGPTSAVCDAGVSVFNTESCTVFAVETETGKQLWSYWLGDPLTSTPAIAGGRVFTSYPAGGRGQQQLPNIGPPGNLPNANPVPNAPNQQQAVPQQQVQENDPDPPQVVAPRRAPAGGKPQPPCSHVLACFDLKTGKILWQRWIESDVMSAPVCVDKEVWVTSFAGVVYKFSQADGQILSAVRNRATSAPVVVGGNVYLTRRADDAKEGKAAEQIAGLGRLDNREQFQGAKREAKYLDPKVQNSAKLKGQAMQLDAGNGFAGGAPLAANPTAGEQNIGQGNVSSLQAFQGSRVLHYGNQLFNCPGDSVTCNDPASGKELWSFKIKGDLEKEGGFLAAPPAMAGGQLFIATLGGEVLQLDPKEGKVQNRWKVGAELRFQPAIDNGRIYLGTQDGKIICLDTKEAKFTGWPCWGANAAHTGVPAAEAVAK